MPTLPTNPHSIGDSGHVNDHNLIVTDLKDIYDFTYGRAVVPTSVTKGASGSASVNSLGRVTFSATESISLNGVFTSAYNCYQILVTEGGNSAAANTVVNFKLRASGTDVTGGYYYGGQFTSWAGVQGAANGNGSNSVGVGFCANAWVWSVNMTIMNPYTSVTTQFHSSAAGSTYYEGISGIGSASSCDGFTFYPATGTITGFVTVYGLNRAY